MMNNPTTNNKAAITGVVALSGALAFITIKAIEAYFNVHLNGSSAETMGATTVIWHAILNYCGISDVAAEEVKLK
jgi:hypothetical protein